MKKEPNEENIYNRVVAEGFIREGEPNFSELLALGKYIRQTEGYGEKNIIKWLVEFCKKEDEFFNSVTSASLLESVARAAIKNAEFRKISFPIRIMMNSAGRSGAIPTTQISLPLSRSFCVMVDSSQRTKYASSGVAPINALSFHIVNRKFLIFCRIFRGITNSMFQ